jgi:hypothetical protein
MGYPLVTRMRCSFSARPALHNRALPIVLGRVDLGCGDLRCFLAHVVMAFRTAVVLIPAHQPDGIGFTYLARLDIPWGLKVT